MKKWIITFVMAFPGLLLPGFAMPQINNEADDMSFLSASGISQWDLIATVDLGGVFTVIANAEIETTGSTFTATVTTETISGLIEVYSIPFSGAHNNGVYTVSNLPFDAVPGEDLTINNLTFTIVGNNLTGSGTFTAIIPGVGSLPGTIDLTGTKVGSVLNLSVLPTILNIGATTGSTASFNITSNTNWSIACDKTWLTVSQTTGANNATITVTAANNFRTTERMAYITVSASELASQTVTVNQTAGASRVPFFPAARYGHSVSSIDGMSFIFGGATYKKNLKSTTLTVGNIATLSSDLYGFDPSTNIFIKLDPEIRPGSDALPGMMGHNAGSYNNKMYVFNGERGEKMNQSTYVFDPATYTWEQDKTPKTFSPRSHAFSETKIASNDSFHIIGGQKRDSTATDSCWSFNAKSKAWSRLKLLPSPAIYSGASVVTGGKFYAVGGMTDFGVTNRIVSFDLTSGNWDVAGDGLPTGLYGMAFASLKNKLFLYGGAGEIGLKSNTIDGDNPPQFSTTLYQLNIDTISGKTNVFERAIGLPASLYGVGWVDVMNSDTLFYQFGGIESISSEGDTTITNNFYRFNLTDSLIQQYDSISHTWGGLLLKLEVSANSVNIPASSSNNNTIRITSNVNWGITSSQSWLTVNPISGIGNRTITLSAEANPMTTERTATLTVSATGVAPKTIMVTQATGAASLSVSPITLNITSTEGSTTTFAVTSNTGWTISSDQTWLTINPASGTGNGTITLTSGANQVTLERMATITVSAIGEASKTVVVTQAAGAATLSISATTLNIAATSGSTAMFNIISNVHWTASSDQIWLSVSPGSGTGNGTVTITAEANPLIVERTAIVTVSGEGIVTKTVTINQSAGMAMLDVSSEILSFDPNGGTKTVDVISNAIWHVSTEQWWIRVEPDSGIGNGIISVTVGAFALTGEAFDLSRTGNITILDVEANSKTVTITQEGSAGISDNKVSGVLVYPNPFIDGFYVNTINRSTIISIFDIGGRLILKGNISGKEYIPADQMENGMYLIELTNDHSSVIRKLIKQ